MLFDENTENMPQQKKTPLLWTGVASEINTAHNTQENIPHPKIAKYSKSDHIAHSAVKLTLADHIRLHM